MTGVAEDENPGVRDTARRVQMYGCCGGASEVNVALHDIMVATQDSFRTQLADMRESLNKVTLPCVRRVEGTFVVKLHLVVKTIW